MYIFLTLSLMLGLSCKGRNKAITSTKYTYFDFQALLLSTVITPPHREQQCILKRVHAPMHFHLEALDLRRGEIWEHLALQNRA